MRVRDVCTSRKEIVSENVLTTRTVCTWREYCLCHSSDLALSLCSVCLFVHKRSGSYVLRCPRPCSSTCRWVTLATHRRRGPPPVCIPCPHAHFGRVPTASVTSSRDWAVSTSSHIQQDMDISGVSSRLDALFPLFDTVKKPRPQNFAITFSQR